MRWAGPAASSDGATRLRFKRPPDVVGDRGKCLLAGGGPGVDEAARPPGLLRPACAGVGLGAVGEVADQMSVTPTSP